MTSVWSTRLTNIVVTDLKNRGLKCDRAVTDEMTLINYRDEKLEKGSLAFPPVQQVSPDNVILPQMLVFSSLKWRLA